jgi:two-component system sensor histidine kinase DesK
MSLKSVLEKLSRRLPPVDLEHLPLWGLMYLGLLLLPLGWRPLAARWLVPTLLSVPIFLPLYLLSYRKGATPWRTAAVALLGIALTPLNGFASTYLVYSATLALFAFRTLPSGIVYILTVVAIYAVECLFVGIPLYVAALVAVICLASGIGNYAWIQTLRKNAQLRMSHEEIRRLATLAERERIGRDLHDLLGHTLSLIAIKGELAEKLVRRDAEAAAREIADVKAIARDALKEVRVAVSGFRAAALEGELAAARALLGSSGVELTASRTDAALPADVESSVAMIVREAVTNIHRHSGARHATIEIRNDADSVLLVVRDDGKGGIIKRGNGLTGIGERVHNLAGTLDITSSPGKGTVVSARLPLPART